MELIIFVIVVIILGISAKKESNASNRRKQYYLDKARECSMKGYTDEANKFIELATRISCR